MAVDFGRWLSVFSVIFQTFLSVEHTVTSQQARKKISHNLTKLLNTKRANKASPHWRNLPPDNTLVTQL